MLPISKVQGLILKHSELEKDLSSGKIDKKNFAEKSKEYSELNEIIKEAISYRDYEKSSNDLEKIINDSKSDNEIVELATKELEELKIDNEINEKR